MRLKKLKPIDTTTMHERAYRELRTALMAGSFRPGETVTLRGVAEGLGTSLMPAREAVRRLVSERALEMPTARSIRVPLSSREAFANLCNIRVQLEGYAAQCAAERSDGPLVDELAEINDTILVQRKAGDLQGMLAANQRFHMAVYEASENGLLVSLIENLWLLNGPYLTLLADKGVNRKQFNFDEHDRLLEAMRRRDGDGARDAIRDDIQGAFELYKEKIKAVQKTQAERRRA